MVTNWALVYVIATALLLIGVVLLQRQRARQTRRTERAASSAESQRRARESIRVTDPAGTETAPPVRDRKDPGSEVLEHLRRLEARASPGLTAQVIPIFLQDTAARLTALRQAVARRDGDAAYRVAHSLHGSASMVGATSLERGCTEIIREVRSGSFDRCEMFIAELDADFESIRRAVTA